MKRILKVAGVTGVLIAALIVNGCAGGGYLGFWKEQRETKKSFEDEPSAALLRDLDPENAYLLAGKIRMQAPYQKPVLTVAVSDTFKKREIAARVILQPPLRVYQAYLPEGEYDLYFFADLDENGFFETHEMIGQISSGPVSVNAKAVVRDLIVNGPDVTLNPKKQAVSSEPINVPVREQSYIYDSLDNDFFAPEYGPLGLYDYKTFIAHVQRFLFALEAFDREKTFVLFVHGVQGTPRDFKYLVEGLDKSRYQPWFFYYPSGMPLGKISSLLSELVMFHAGRDKGNIKRMIVVAHSMGGLVALSALNNLCVDGKPPYLLGYISFNSPYGGVKDARKGVEKAPAVVPSWRDVATGSNFLEKMYQGQATAVLPFYLFFGYKGGESSDGTITLESQLYPQVHFKTYKSYGFGATHVGVLNDPFARQTFNRVLDQLDERE